MPRGSACRTGFVSSPTEGPADAHRRPLGRAMERSGETRAVRPPVGRCPSSHPRRCPLEVLAKFRETFVDPNNAGLFIDRDGPDGYNWTTIPRVETEDALAEIAPDAEVDQLERLAADLNGEFPAWARRSDLD